MLNGETNQSGRAGGNVRRGPSDARRGANATQAGGFRGTHVADSGEGGGFAKGLSASGSVRAGDDS